MKAIVAERGQVTIPKQIRDRLGIVPKSVLEFREENGKLIVTKVTEKDPVESVLGCLDLKTPTDELIAELRDAE